MRAGFPAWQQFNQRTNFINPSAIRGGGTSGTRYARNRGREGERRAWRRIGEPAGGGEGRGGGGREETEEEEEEEEGRLGRNNFVNARSSRRGHRFFIARSRSRAADYLGERQRKTFQTSCLSSRPIADIWARSRVRASV